MYQPSQTPEPFQQLVDFIGGLSEKTGIDRLEFYRYIGSLEAPETGKMADVFIKNLNGQLPCALKEIQEAYRLSMEDIKEGRLMPIDDSFAEMEAAIARTGPAKKIFAIDCRMENKGHFTGD
jgi:hypothetical protein